MDKHIHVFHVIQENDNENWFSYQNKYYCLFSLLHNFFCLSSNQYKTPEIERVEIAKFLRSKSPFCFISFFAKFDKITRKIKPETLIWLKKCYFQINQEFLTRVFLECIFSHVSADKRGLFFCMHSALLIRSDLHWGSFLLHSKNTLVKFHQDGVKF